jgi:hypothetical protein
VSLGEATSCGSEPDPHSGRPVCVSEPQSRQARLNIFETPWKDVRLPRACICDNTTALLPLTHITSGRALEITFYVDDMSPDEDFESLFFNASFELVRAPECPRKQRVRGEGESYGVFQNLQKATVENFLFLKNEHKTFHKNGIFSDKRNLIFGYEWEMSSFFKKQFFQQILFHYNILSSQ